MTKNSREWLGWAGIVLAGSLLASCDSGKGLYAPSTVESGAAVTTAGADSQESVVVSDAVVAETVATVGALEKESLFLKKLELPVCDAANPEVRFISDAEGWKDINSARYRVFCIKPGDYRPVGNIVLNSSGSEAAPRVIVLDGRSKIHPAKLAESDQAIVRSLEFDRASHWVVSGISLVDAVSTQPVVHLDPGSSFNTLDGMRIEHFYQGIILEDGASGNVFQNNLIGDLFIRKGGDGVCIGLQGFRTRASTVSIQNTRILNNEIYNCNDGIQTIINPAINYKADFSGLVVDGNDIYLTSARYSDCRGNMNPKGKCACAENAIDLKGGAEDSANPVRIINNHLWGWRRTDTLCGGSGSWGSAISAHFRLQNTDISHNTIFDSSRGISVSEGPRGIDITNNLIHGINSPEANEGVAMVTTVDTLDLNFERNTIVDANIWMNLNARQSSFECNVIIDSGAADGVLRDRTVVGRNSYYGTVPWKGSAGGDIVFGSGAESRNVDHCFNVKDFKGTETVCLSYGSPTAESPHHACASGS